VVTAALQTRIAGSPESIRGVATWLSGSFSTASTTLSDDVRGQRAQSTTAWVGDAGDGQRRRLTTLADSADAVSGIATGTAGDLETLASALQTAQSEMERARSVALAGGLAVTGTLVQAPGPAPASVPPLPADATPAEVAAHDQGTAAVTEHNAQVTAWNTTVGIAEGAQTGWAEALASAAGTWQSNSANLTGLTNDLLSAGVSAGAIAAVAFNASQRMAGYQAASQAYAAHVRAVTTPEGRITTSASHFYELFDGSKDNAALAARAAEDLRGARVPVGLGRGLLVLGLAATGYGIYDDMQHGESPAQAAVSNGVGLLASLGAGAAAGAGVGALVGTFIPVPVVGTVAGAVVGTIVGTGVGLITSGAIDSMWENGVDDLGDVGDALADGWDELTGTVSDAGDLVGDAAGAVGGAAKDAWNAIF
jgi:hypothetical protein